MKCIGCGKELGISCSDECAFCPSYIPNSCDGRLNSEWCNECCRKHKDGPGRILIG